MTLLVLLSDRTPEAALPALSELRFDLKVQPLAVPELEHVRELEPAAVLVDAGENAGQAWSVLTALRAMEPRIATLVIVERDQLERFPWHEVADEFVYPGAPPAEIGLRVTMLRRRAGASDGSTIRLGPLAIDTDSYRVTASGRPIDLTFKEFELLRFLASPARAASSRGRRSCARCGATTSTAARARSTSTFGACGPSSAPSTSI